MKLVVCTECGVVFDIEVAKKCDGHEVPESKRQIPFRRESCFVCPLGHAGHDSRRWQDAERRPATAEERKSGLLFMLPDYEVLNESQKCFLLGMAVSAAEEANRNGDKESVRSVHMFANAFMSREEQHELSEQYGPYSWPDRLPRRD